MLDPGFMSQTRHYDNGVLASFVTVAPRTRLLFPSVLLAHDNTFTHDCGLLEKMALRITSASPGFIQSLSQEMERCVPIRGSIVIFPESWDQQVYFSLRSISRHFSETQVMLNIQTWLSSRPHIDLHQCSEPERCFDLRPKLSFDLNGVRSHREAKPALI